MKAIKLEIKDFINQDKIIHDYKLGSYDEFVESIARSHNIPVKQLQIKESVTNSIIINESDLIKNCKNLIIDSPNPLFYDSSSIVQSIVLHQKSTSPIRMVDKEIQCDPEQKQMIQIQPKLLSNEKSFASTFQNEINQEEMKMKLKEFVTELKYKYFEVLTNKEDPYQEEQNQFIDKLRRNRVQQLKQYDKEIQQIENKITEITEQLMEVKLTSEEQIQEIQRILELKNELEKSLQQKELKRTELQQQLNQPMNEQEIRDQFYKMKWKLLKKIELFKKKLNQYHIIDDEFLEQLTIIQQKAELLNKKFSSEILFKSLK